MVPGLLASADPIDVDDSKTPIAMESHIYTAVDPNTSTPIVVDPNASNSCNVVSFNADPEAILAPFLTLCILISKVYKPLFLQCALRSPSWYTLESLLSPLESLPPTLYQLLLGILDSSLWYPLLCLPL